MWIVNCIGSANFSLNKLYCNTWWGLIMVFDISQKYAEKMKKRMRVMMYTVKVFQKKMMNCIFRCPKHFLAPNDGLIS